MTIGNYEGAQIQLGSINLELCGHHLPILAWVALAVPSNETCEISDEENGLRFLCTKMMMMTMVHFSFSSEGAFRDSRFHVFTGEREIDQ